MADWNAEDDDKLIHYGSWMIPVYMQTLTNLFRGRYSKEECKKRYSELTGIQEREIPKALRPTKTPKKKLSCAFYRSGKGLCYKGDKCDFSHANYLQVRSDKCENGKTKPNGEQVQWKVTLSEGDRRKAIAGLQLFQAKWALFEREARRHGRI